MERGNKTWKSLSWVSFIVSVVTLCFGLYKMFVYDSGDYYPYESRNAYVGGDAYNFIINGNYATGFFVLTAVFVIMGIGFGVLYYLSKMDDLLAVQMPKTPDQLKAEEETRRRAEEERERKEQQRKMLERIEAEKKARYNEYWNVHAEEHAALIAQKEKAIQKLNELGGLATAEKRAIQELIRSIDEELAKDR